MKALKVIGVIALFGVVIYLAMGLKGRIVQNSCKAIGDYKATKSADVLGSDNDESWYCCPPKMDKNTTNCVFYGE